MDDFYLQPHQRTEERLAEPGGNVDRERFLQEVLIPLHEGHDAVYRVFDCQILALTDTAGTDYGHGELPKGIGTVSWFGRETNGVDSSDSWQEYIFTDYPEKLENLVLTGEFITADPYIAGDWKVSFPLKSISE